MHAPTKSDPYQFTDIIISKDINLWKSNYTIIHFVDLARLILLTFYCWYCSRLSRPLLLIVTAILLAVIHKHNSVFIITLFSHAHIHVPMCMYVYTPTYSPYPSAPLKLYLRATSTLTCLFPAPPFTPSTPSAENGRDPHTSCLQTLCHTPPPPAPTPSPHGHRVEYLAVLLLRPTPLPLSRLGVLFQQLRRVQISQQ